MGRLAALEVKLMGGGLLSHTEQVELAGIARYYRRLLAIKTAEAAFVEMKDFAQIDAEIRALGYRLVKIVNSRIPVLEEIESA